MQELTPAKRRDLGRKAAQARWGKNKAEFSPAPEGLSPRKTGKRRKSGAATPNQAFPLLKKTRPVKQARVFGFALTAAEKRLAHAIEERARAASTWAVLNAEIPSLQRTIAALRNQQNPNIPMQNYAMPLPDGSMLGYQGNGTSVGYDLTTVVSGAPIPFAPPAQSSAPPQAPAPRPLAASRAGGGAVGINLADNENEDRFLEDSSVAGGQWH